MKTKKYPDDFLKRMEYYQLFKRRNLENLRNKFFLNKANDLRFEPKINIIPNKNIQSKVYNSSNFGKTKKENTNNEKNEENTKVNEEEKNTKVNENESQNEKEKEKEDQNYLTVKQKLNKNNLTKFSNTYNNKFISDYKTEDIWPKDLIQKYLDNTQNNENCKNDN